MLVCTKHFYVGLIGSSRMFVKRENTADLESVHTLPGVSCRLFISVCVIACACFKALFPPTVAFDVFIHF